MELNIPKNIVCKEEFIPGKEHSARIIGSGDVEVLSTPSMILFMEITSWRCIQKYLSENHTTVGTRVCVDHKAPAPIGEKIVVETRLEKVIGRKLVFHVKALWREHVIGEGIHERYIVERNRFIEKLRRMLSK